MKKLMLALLAFTGLISSLQGETCDNRGLYIGGFGGVNFLNDLKDNIGLTGGLAVGYKFYDNSRIEIEGAYRYNSSRLYFENYRNAAYSVMANMYYDLDFGYAWMPYFGLGAGYVYTKADWKENILNSTFFSGRSYLHERSERLAYQGMVGIEREIWDHAQVSIEYRCFFRHGDLRDQSALFTLKNYF